MHWQPLGPVLPSNAQLLAEEQRAKSAAVNEQVTLDAFSGDQLQVTHAAPSRRRVQWPCTLPSVAPDAVRLGPLPQHRRVQPASRW